MTSHGAVPVRQVRASLRLLTIYKTTTTTTIKTKKMSLPSEKFPGETEFHFHFLKRYRFLD